MTRRGLARLLALILAVAAAIGPGAARARTVCTPDAHPGGEWRQMNLDPANTRDQRDEHVINRLNAPLLKPFWTFSANDAAGEINNEVTGYPIVADGCVFVGTNRGFGLPGWVFALNADGGDIAWKTRLKLDADPEWNGHLYSGGVYSTVAAGDGVVYAYVSRVGGPFVVALDEADGHVLWRTTVDRQAGSDAVASPVVYNGMVWVGVSGTAAEGDDTDRFAFRGKSVLLDAATGALLSSTPAISDEDWDFGNGDAGGSIWSTIAIDPATQYGWVGTGNPFSYKHENANTNAILKIDLARARDTASGAALPSNIITNSLFGKITGSYKGDVEQYFPDVAGATNCDEDETVGTFLAGIECGHLDLDFGAAPNLFPDPVSGRLLVGEGQKSGVYHVLDAETMQPVWKQIVGVPSAVGGVVGTPAYDGSSLFVPHTIAGYIASLKSRDGSFNWVTPVADAVHWGEPVTAANGVIYTVDLKGFLDAYDAATGAPLLHRPMNLEADTGLNPTFSWAGATVARNTVYATVGVGLTSVGSDYPSMPDGFVIAFRPRVLP